jgi:hypothetical protein
LALSLVACGGPGTGLGSFASSGGLLGTWSVSAARCHSGMIDRKPLGPVSIVYFKRGGDELSTTVNSRHTNVWVHRGSPFREVDIAPEACRRFEVRHVMQPDGRIGADVELDCDTGDGGRVTASLHAPSCP